MQYVLIFHYKNFCTNELRYTNIVCPLTNNFLLDPPENKSEESHKKWQMYLHVVMSDELPSRESNLMRLETQVLALRLHFDV